MNSLVSVLSCFRDRKGSSSEQSQEKGRKERGLEQSGFFTSSTGFPLAMAVIDVKNFVSWLFEMSLITTQVQHFRSLFLSL